MNWIIAGSIAAVLIIVQLLTVLYFKGIIKRGNAKKYSVAQTAPLTDSKLCGKTIIFLGSSVTYGSASMGESFADFLAARNSLTAIKEAVSGTTLVTENELSYIPRMKKLDKNIKADAFICQLSTNDATKKKPLGEVSQSFDLSDFDVSTVAGAIEYIICYAKENWHCPVIFYTGTRYKSEQYPQMIELLYKLREKHDIGIIDLWNDDELNDIDKKTYRRYMANGIHPVRAGYRDWWTPKFEEYLDKYFGE